MYDYTSSIIEEVKVQVGFIICPGFATVNQCLDVVLNPGHLRRGQRVALAVWLSGKAFAYFKELKKSPLLVLSTTKEIRVPFPSFH